MSMTLEQRDELRIAVINFLAPRRKGAFNASQIGDRLRHEHKVDFAFVDGEVNDACGDLLKYGHVKEISEMEFAIIPHYQATKKGVMASEKWRAARGLA
ncbi:MAG: hypothetical protein WC657_09590 [Candidatus Paceibacterota bacterium]|jgi:hypothetical protein